MAADEQNCPDAHAHKDEQTHGRTDRPTDSAKQYPTAYGGG